MQELMKFLFGSADLMPHGNCFLWQPSLLWLTVTANIVIALAYFSIPVALLYFVYKRKQVEFKGILLLFSLFIFSCGATHVMHVVTIWKPVYGLSGIIDALTAGVSVVAAVMLWPLIPKALLIPSPSELLKANSLLQDEIRYNLQIQNELKRLNQDLDKTVELLQQSNQAFQESEQRFKHVVNVTPTAIYTLLFTGHDRYPYRTTFISDAFLSITGFAPVDWYSNDSLWIDRLHPDDREQTIELMEQLKETGQLNHQYRFRHKDGSYRWIHDRSIMTRTSTGDIDEVFGAWMDVTEHKEAEEELHLAAITFESLQGIMITDPDATILRVNQAFTTVTGYSAEEVIGKNPNILHSDRHDQSFYEDLWRQLEIDGRFEGEIWDRRKDGSIFPIWQCITAVKNNRGETTHYVAVFTDLSEKKKFEEYISQLAFYDPLTDLPNRRLLLERIEQVLIQAKRKNTYAAILYMDLDRFKVLNDSMGHQTGDELLVQVAKRLKQSIRQEDTPTRLGGDEFVILVHTDSDRQDEATQKILNLSEKIMRKLNEPYLIKGNEHYFSSSMGVTLFSGQCQLAATDLLQQADTAMYRSKEKGRNTISFFDQSMQEAADKSLQIENALRMAIEQQQFTLYFQPQVDRTGRIISAEALIRWNYPGKGLIAPNEFIPIAEETGIIQQIGAWVIEASCRQIKLWQQAGRDYAYVSVNVSSQQFRQKDFVIKVKQAIVQADIESSRLMIEITESVLMQDINDTVEKMQALTELGIAISIDDFGTGYSSLAYLTQFPLSQLKIDQRFVKNIDVDKNSAVIVETIIAMAGNLGLKVVAEGVETERQLEFLVEKGCVVFQGYFFGKPVPVDQFGMNIE
ncbi:EAL domain-containing protein [Methylotuvimicrobium sp. KM2]|uniref:sensor domain-containing protein n=1 Tax=Methylotuvimicrobium sp. KM2 TaxID=3133976 RepID=UPI003100D2CE